MLKVIQAKHHGYSEIGQQKPIKFAFANAVGNEIREIFSPVLCRDFLGDVLHAEESNKPASIYGFSYNPTTSRIDRDSTRLVISNISAKDFDCFRANAPILEQLEFKLNLVPTKWQEVDKHLYIEGSPRWQEAVYLISFYTYLLRVMCYPLGQDWMKDVAALKTNEGSYFRSVTEKKFITMAENLFNILEPFTNVHGWKNDAHIGVIHDMSGFVSLATTAKGNTYADKLKEYFK